ncbi:MAG: ABC transporter ATP-binding protein [Spartobacteria bacterium]|nr:ABC transporter ATP-binding protein [Spartobacteria bacterium]
MDNICKSFGDVHANRNISFQVRGGEIYALLGENGAGKSTLMNILSGIYAPDSGEIHVHGEQKHFTSPSQSIAAGIGMIYQHFKLVDPFTAAENVILGQKKNRILHKRQLNTQIKKLAETYGFDIEPGKQVYDMSVSEKQTVEILKVLYRGADILILDEPTAVLTPQETQRLFDVMRSMRDAGCAVVIITHKLHEIMEISDWVTVMRKGETVGTVRTADTTPGELTNMMVGKTVELSIHRPKSERCEDMLRISDLTVRDEEGVLRLDHVSFSMNGGAILGVAGVAGSGQKELCEAISGLQKLEKGSIRYLDEEIGGLAPRDISQRGILMSFIPEDRLGMGLVANMDMVDNIILRDYHRQPGVLLQRKPAAAKASKLVKQLNIQTPGIHHAVKNLSGGNIQKVLLGREIESDPHVLVTAYATRGLDVGSSHVIYDLLNAQKKKKVAILYFGEDLDVLLELSDRIMVLCEGRVSGIVDPQTATKEDLGLLMSGALRIPQEEWV